MPSGIGLVTALAFALAKSYLLFLNLDFWNPFSEIGFPKIKFNDSKCVNMPNYFHSSTIKQSQQFYNNYSAVLEEFTKKYVVETKPERINRYEIYV